MIEINATPEQREAAHALMMSPTMSLLCELAQGESLDFTTPDGLKTGFCTAGLDVIRALDAGRIHFDKREDAAMLHGLLMVCMQAVFDGKFAQGVTWHTARMQ